MEQILTTKLYIPHTRPELVSRPRLIERLNKGLYRKLILISAPAGFGKTTLVTEWLDNLRLDAKNNIAWLSLDDGDNDYARFLTYFIAALNRAEGIESNFGEGALSMLQSPQPPPIETVLTPLINEIATLPDRIFLVLDDYHVIESSQVDDVLSFLIEHLPPQIHLVIATREDPHLPLSRLRSRDQLTELRADDLRFSSSEAADFLNQVMVLDLSAEDISALETRTEGWIVGLQLAAISLQGRDDATNFIESFTGSHRLVLDYLMEEVLEHQSENVQAFLLKTAVLDRLTGSLCDALTGQDNGQETLEMLARANMFIIPLDGERQWYRYHHLFTDLLLQRLNQTQSAQLASLHRKASKWYELNGFNDEAIEYALQGDDFERAAGLIELAWPAMDESFQSDKWLGWVKSLSDEMVRARPVLSVGYAWALLNGGQMEAADTRLKDAERWLELTTDMSDRVEDPPTKTRPDTLRESRRMVVVDDEQFRSLPASIATIRAFLAQTFGDMPGTVKYARRALGLLPEDDYITRGRVAVILGLAYWANGDLEPAHQSYADGMANMRKVGNILFTIAGTFILADIRITQGRLREALRTYKQSLQLAADEGVPMLSGTEDLYRGMSEIHYEQGDQEAARQNLKRSEELSEPSMVYQYRLCIAQARIKEAQGDPDGALDLLEEAERWYPRSVLPDVRPVSALKTRVWVAQGKLDEAQGWVRERGLSVDDGLTYLREFEHITLARVFIAQYKIKQIERSIHEVKGLLDRLLGAAEEGERTGSVIEILVLQTLVQEAQGEISLALVSLERALTLAEPEGYIRIFVDEGPAMALLLHEVLSRADAQNSGFAHDYIRRLLVAFPDTKPEQADSVKRQAPGSELVEPLSERELDVLRLLAENLKYKQIAEQLVVSVNTIRHHTKNIYGKLEVNNRTLAVQKAKEYNLL
ncbi:LuxR C-terminal-related transcriptional regulator [Chloroflexota bacterium]